MPQPGLREGVRGVMRRSPVCGKVMCSGEFEQWCGAARSMGRCAAGSSSSSAGGVCGVLFT